jgi:alkylation response protein AidB-like acyl-CoA dehydrogenase
MVAGCTDPNVPWPKGLSFFVVPGDTPGFSASKPLDKVGIWLNQNADLTFENCRQPALGAHRQHPAGRSRGTLLRHARRAKAGGVAQTERPPENPGRFNWPVIGQSS